MILTFAIIIGMLILSIIAPFVSLYAVSLIKKKGYKKHIQIQKTLFWICLIAVIILEVQIRISGGSGSLIVDGKYVGTDLFKYTLTAHIIGAVLTYIIWAITIFVSNTKWKKKEPCPARLALPIVD